MAAPSGPYSLATLATGTRVLSIAARSRTVQTARSWAETTPASRRASAFATSTRSSRRRGREDRCRPDRHLLTDMADRAAVARAREEYFGEHRPAATLVQVVALVAPELKVEIEATAVF